MFATWLRKEKPIMESRKSWKAQTVKNKQILTSWWSKFRTIESQIQKRKRKSGTVVKKILFLIQVWDCHGQVRLLKEKMFNNDELRALRTIELSSINSAVPLSLPSPVFHRKEIRCSFLNISFLCGFRVAYSNKSHCYDVSEGPVFICSWGSCGLTSHWGPHGIWAIISRLLGTFWTYFCFLQPLSWACF